MRAMLVLAAAAALLAPGQALAARGTFRKDPTRLVVAFDDSVGRAERLEAMRGLGLEVLEDFDPAAIAVVRGRTGFTPAAFSVRSAPGVVDVVEDFYTNWLVAEEPSFGRVPLPSFGEVMKGLPRVRPSLAAPAAGSADAEAPWGVRRVNAPAAWNRSAPATMGAGARVAVIDTGIDCGHPDLSCSYAEGYNAADKSAPPKDDNGHGTHVAGTIAAKWDGSGVAGVAPMARVVPVKVLDKDGNGWLTTIIKGIVWAARNDVHVINMSLGSSNGVIFLHWAVKFARSKGVTVVAAAGNEGPDDDTVSYPGGYEEAIGVAASDSKDGVAFFSSRGKQVDLIAPGVDVRSAVTGGKYDEYSGTSMAAPHVAGLAAIAVAQGARGPAAVWAALKAAASPLCPGGAGGKPGKCHRPEEQGLGMVDAAKLIRR